jgi:hypothetical protein
MSTNGDALARLRAKIKAKQEKDKLKAQRKLEAHRRKEARKANKRNRNKRDTRGDK